MCTLEKLNSSFSTIKAAVDIMDISDDMNIKRLHAVTSKMKGFEPAFKKLESEMLDERADIIEWEELAQAVDQYNAIADAVAEKLIVRKKRDEVQKFNF